MHKNSSGIIHILLILVVIAVVGVVLILGKDKIKLPVSIGSPVPSAISDSTASWKTYTSEKGFQISYPPDWKTSNLYAASEIGTLKGIDFSNSTIGEGVQVEWVSSEPSPFCPYTTVSLDTKAGMIDLCQTDFPGGGVSLVTYVSKYGKIFLVQAGSKASDGLILAVISTFQITN